MNLLVQREPVSNNLLIGSLHMARFQALTNPVLDLELDMIRDRLNLQAHQKAELLREMTGLVAWIVRQAELGRVVQARRGDEVEPLVHPALERLRDASQTPIGEPIALRPDEVSRLAAILERGFDPPPALQKALANLANPRRRPPRLRWNKPEQGSR